MVKVLLTILLIILGSKTILDNAVPAYKDSIAQTATQEEESKHDKEDSKQSKKHFEELYYNNSLENSSDITPPFLSFFLSHQQPYSQFVNKLNTPPPDFI